MEEIGIIVGTSLFGAEIKGEEEIVNTPHGKVSLLKTENAFLIQRHGKNTPPHKINHHANIYALKEKGVKQIIGLGSTGSLKLDLKPPTLVIPEGYINFWELSGYDHEKIPRFNSNLREKIKKACEKSEIKTYDKGIYAQTQGPRLETEAEIRLLKDYAEIVGMTISAEADTAKEFGLEYACLCSVDNYCNGITEEPLTYEQILANAKNTQSEIEKILGELIK